MKILAAILLVCFWTNIATAQGASDEDKGYLTNLIEDNLSGEGRTVTITGFAGALSSEARIAQITISDPDGVWLTLDNVALIWNRSALLRGRIDVEKLVAEKIVLARLPVSESAAPAPEATPFSLPELPVGLQLDELDIARIELGETVLGQPLAFSLIGNASLESGALDSTITANRLDAKAGLFDIAVRYNNADRVLGLELAISEDAGGLAATLLDLPGNPAVAMTINGEAPIDAYAAQLSIATDGVERIAGDFGLSSTDQGTGFSLDIAGDVTTLFLPEYQDFFGPQVQLVADGAQLAAGGFRLNNLDLKAQSLQLSGNATIDAGGLPAQISLSGRIQDSDGEIVLLPLAGEKIYVDRVDLNVGYDRTISDDWTAEFNIAGFDRPGLLIRQMTLAGGGIISRDDTSKINASMGYVASGLTLDDAGMTQALGDQISGEIDVDWSTGAPTSITRLTLDGAGLNVLADATINGVDDGLNTSLNMLLDVAGLDRFTTLANRPLQGAAELVLLGQFAPLNGTFDAILTGKTVDLGVGIAQLDPYLKGNGDLSVQAIRDASGTRIEALKITTPLAVITARADLTRAGSNASLVAALTDIAPVLDSVSGPAKLIADITQNTAGTISFDTSGTLPAVTFSATGDVHQNGDDRTVNFNTAAAVTDATVYNKLTGQSLSGAATLMVDGVLLGDGQRFDLNIAGVTQDLQTGIAQLDPLLLGAGRISGEVARFAQDRFRVRDFIVTTPAMNVTASGTGGVSGAAQVQAALSVDDAALLDPALAGPVAIALSADRTGGDVATIVLEATAPSTDIAADVTVAPPSEGYAINGAVTAKMSDLGRYRALIGQPLSGGINTTIKGNLLPDLSAFDVVLDATTRNLAVGNTSIDKLLSGNGTIGLTANQSNASLSVPRLNIVFDNIAASGALDGKNATGEGRFEARLRDIGLFTDQLSGPVTANGTARRNAQSWGLDVQAGGPGGIAATAAGTYGDNGQLAMNIDGSAPLGLANDILDPRRASGDLQFDLAVNGPPQLSSVAGTISLNNGQIAAPNLAQTLRNVAGTVRLVAGRAQIAISGDLDEGGQINIDGPITLTAPYQGDVTARLAVISLSDPNLYDTTVDGTISLNGPLAGGAQISGALTLGRTELQVPSSGIGALGDLPDVTHIGAASSVNRTLSRAGALGTDTSSNGGASSGPAYPLNIKIDAPSKIFVRGRGLDAELGGALTLGGTTQNIIPLGQFSLVRGRLNILQQRFDLSEGTATLQGDFTPYLRLVAQTEAATGTSITITVEGPASAPVVTFSSSPELPQDEVISQLIFGRNLTDISPLQAIQLAAAVGTLAGRGGGGLIDTFRQDIGLDDFDVTTDDDGNAALRAGKYISDNVYTDITVNTEGDTDITINLDLTDSVTAKGTLGTDGETSIGIFYERDY